MMVLVLDIRFSVRLRGNAAALLAGLADVPVSGRGAA
jgi:hypothetical protein